MPDKVGQQIGNYRLIQLLGSGGFADVYLGQHVHVQRLQAAVKILHANLGMVHQGGFFQEAETIAGLKHRHIIRILDFGIDRDNAPYLIMEYASHGTLRIRHPKGSIVPSRIVVFYVKQITEALQYAHDHSLIHRDLKPENLLIGENDEIVLSDFGIASVAQGTASTASLETGTYAGTIPYSAPEQIQGKPRRASDQYSLGIIVYEWLSGERPFTGTMMEIISQQLGVAPSPLHEKVPNIPSEVESVVMTALDKDPRQRFGSVLAFANALEQACLPSHQPPPAEEFIPNQGPPAGTLTIPDTPQEDVVSQQSEQGVPVKLVSDSEEIAALPATEPVLQQSLQSVPDTAHASDMIWTEVPPVVSKRTPDSTGIISRRGITRRRALQLGIAGAVTATGIGVIVYWVEHSTSAPGTPAPLETYHGHTDAVYAVAWSPDRNRIASGSGDSTVQVWNATDGSNVFTYTGHTEIVNAVTWSPDGTRIASGSYDKTVQVWNATDGSHAYEYTGHTAVVEAVAWSRDGKHIASGSYDKTVQVWEAP